MFGWFKKQDQRKKKSKTVDQIIAERRERLPRQMARDNPVLEVDDVDQALNAVVNSFPPYRNDSTAAVDVFSASKFSHQPNHHDHGHHHAGHNYADTHHSHSSHSHSSHSDHSSSFSDSGGYGGGDSGGGGDGGGGGGGGSD